MNRRTRRFRFGVCGLAAVATLLLASGCLTTPTGSSGDGGDHSSKPSDTCGARVFLVLGLWDVFSVGLNSLGEEMRAAGVNAAVVSSADWPALLDRLIAEGKAGIDTPLVLVGHSYGADDVIEIARQLKKHDIRIELLGLIDSTDPGRITANVDRCVHLYLPNALGSIFPDAFSGNPVVAEPGNTHTVIENITVTANNFGSGANGVDHFNIESSAAVHSFLVDEALAVCPSTESQ